MQYSWVAAGAGKSGLSCNYTARTRHDGRAVYRYIDTGSAEDNQAVFDDLHSHRDEIEAAYGGDLSWEHWST